MQGRDNALRQASSSGFAPKRPLSNSSGYSAAERDEKYGSGGSSGGGSGGGRSSAWDRGYGGDDDAPRYKRQRGNRSSSPPADDDDDGRPNKSAADPTGGLGANPFVSGTDKLLADAVKKHGNKAAAEAAIRRDREAANAANAGAAGTAGSKSLGGKRKGFVPPYKKTEEATTAEANGPINPMLQKALAGPSGKAGDVHPKLQSCDPKLIELITFEMMESVGVTWDDIAGLHFAKKTLREIVVWPLLRPDVFTGLRGPPKGLLLFGPPGTGKTLIGKALASESRSSFFSISASSLTSKWHGEGEKLVRTLFAMAQVHEPSIIFIDEIDSLLAARQESEFEASRRIKTEFLVQMDGCGTTGKERVLVVGATNRPQELDEAARRRLVKKLYIPLPDNESRMQLLQHTLRNEHHCLTESDLAQLVARAAGYSGSDMAALCKEASMEPIRCLSASMDIAQIEPGAVRPIERKDFDVAFKSIRPSVNQKDLAQYIAWNTQFGSFPMDPDANAQLATATPNTGAPPPPAGEADAAAERKQ